MPLINRFARWIALVLLALSGIAAASPQKLAAQADAVILVEVSFVPYGNLVLLRAVLHGAGMPFESPENYLGECLPAKATVRERALAGGAGAPHYQAALERASYSAVLFLKHEGAALTPRCDPEQSEPVHWEQHPGHVAWRAALDVALSGK